MKMRKILAGVLCGALLMTTACGGATKTEQTPTEPVVESGEAVLTSAEPENEKSNAIDKDAIDTSGLQGCEDIAFFGVDTRGTDLGAGTRSDSLMVIHVDHDAQKIKVVSIYRDCMVHIEGHGYEKITHAHSYGGPELAVSTINENFDLDLDDYVTMNFINVADLVDMMGGVTMDITDEEAPHIEGISSAGTYKLTGTQAVAYSRIRHASGGDYKRAERQRDVLFAMFQDLKGLELDTRIQVAEDILKEINTSMTKKDVTSLMAAIATYEIEEMTAYPQVFYGGTVDGAWVEVPCSLVDMATGIHETVYPGEAYEPSDTVISHSGDLSMKVSTPNTDMREQ